MGDKKGQKDLGPLFSSVLRPIIAKIEVDIELGPLFLPIKAVFRPSWNQSYVMSARPR